jgi:hypothetical protein
VYLEGFVRGLERLELVAHEVLHLPDGGDVMSLLEFRLEGFRFVLEKPDVELYSNV